MEEDFKKLKENNERKSLDKSFGIIYDILKHTREIPEPTPVSSVFQIVNQKFTNGETFSVPIFIDKDGVLGIAARYTLDSNITVTRGDETLTLIGENKNDGVTTKLFSAIGLPDSADSLTITVTGDGTYGPFAFYFSEEEEPILAVENYAGYGSSGSMTETITLENTSGGKFVHLAAWAEYNMYRPPSPMPTIENELVGWNVGYVPQQLTIDHDRDSMTNMRPIEGEVGKWQSTPRSSWGWDSCALYLFFKEEKQKIAGFKVDYEFVGPSGRVNTYIYTDKHSGSGPSGAGGDPRFYIRVSDEANIVGFNISSNVEIRVTNVELFKAEEEDLLLFAIGHSTVPAYDGQSLSYKSVFSEKNNSISGAEIKK